MSHLIATCRDWQTLVFGGYPSVEDRPPRLRELSPRRGCYIGVCLDLAIINCLKVRWAFIKYVCLNLLRRLFTRGVNERILITGLRLDFYFSWCRYYAFSSEIYSFALLFWFSIFSFLFFIFFCYIYLFSFLFFWYIYKYICIYIFPDNSSITFWGRYNIYIYTYFMNGLLNLP